MSVNGDKQQPRVTAQVSTAQRLQPISTSANGDKQQPQVTAEASPSQQPKHLGGQASVLTTPKPTQVQLDAITKSMIKRGMGVIIAQATEIMLDGSLHPSDQIATKALTIRKLAHEMNKLLDLTKATDETEEPISHGTDASFTAKRRSQSSSRINSTSNKEWNSSWA
ncbi:MAG: hypothetical protein Q9199_007240 [Rusavskia elegans]